ncbi:MAG: protein phosphatase 2C domain-containing protein [Lachnospiraceae bacterium]|nr:protein phosphatase 2C domain-containing protein [Lachnospiraceae bacterium]
MSRMICGVSVRGASHIRAEKPCEDCYKYQEISDTVALMAVADGHGSDACPFSRTGAKVAVNTFCSVVGGLLANFSDNTELLITYLNREGEVKVAKAIEEEWKRRVWKAHLEHKREVPLNPDGSQKKTAVYRMYGTTLLGLMVLPDFLFAFQLGDGDMMSVDAEHVEPIVETDKILGTETHSLSSENAWKNAVTAVHRRDRDCSQLYMLSTDGFSNSHASEESFWQTCREYFDMVQENGFESVAENLKGWLAETSELGCGDDITVVMNYYDSQADVHE